MVELLAVGFFFGAKYAVRGAPAGGMLETSSLRTPKTNFRLFHP